MIFPIGGVVYRSKNAHRTGQRLPHIQLEAILRRHPYQAALRQKQQGRWLQWNWSDLSHEVHRLCQGLRAYGVGPGTQVAVQAELGTRTLLLTLAMQILEADLVSVPVEADIEVVRRMVLERQVHHVVTCRVDHSHRWLEAGRSLGLDITVIDGDVEAIRDPQTVSYDLLRAGWGGPDVSQRRMLWPGRRTTSVWVEESTDWKAAPAAILRYWLDLGICLTLPQTLKQAERDRRAIRPQVMLMSLRRLHHLDASIAASQSSFDQPSRQLDGTVKHPRWSVDRPFMRMPRELLRRRMGLDRVCGIEVLDDAGSPIRAALIPNVLRARLVSLGIQVGDDLEVRHTCREEDPLILPIGSF